MAKEDRTDQPPESKGSPSSPPSISLPKGGGAIRFIGEKFAANPVTGTGSMSVPIAVSPESLRLRSAAIAFLRFRIGKWAIRFRLEPIVTRHRS